MKFFTNRLLCFLSVLLVVLSLFPPTTAFSQRAPAPTMPSQFFTTTPESDRVGGSSFGTKSRTQQIQQGISPYPYETTYPTPFPGTSEYVIKGATYQVHILGEVLYPGTYRVPVSARLSEAISFAGNILDRGSQRKIQLRRKGKKTQNIDLLSFKMLGNLDANPYLLDNDVVYVPLKKNVVQISGSVRRPDSYELTKRTSLYDLIKLAGGFTPGVALTAPAKIIRYVNSHKELIDISLDKEESSRFQIRDADIVVIPHLLTEGTKFDYNVPNLPGDSEIFFPSFEERVFVLGAVAKPGPYPYSPYYNVRQYLTQAGGFTKLAKSKENMYIISSLGEKIKANDSSDINPGDTIIVPERYMRPETLVQLVLGVTSTALGITTAILAITR